MKNIIVYTAPVNSGKTSTLLVWAMQQPNLGGILAPDIGLFRYILTLKNRELHPFQVPQLPDNEEVVRICKFDFLESGFDLAKATLLEDAASDFDWVVVDEVGKLELKGEGLEPAVSQLIHQYKQEKTKGKLLLLMREEMLDELMEHYGIELARVVRRGEEI